jgi:hypothetical protein
MADDGKNTPVWNPDTLRKIPLATREHMFANLLAKEGDAPGTIAVFLAEAFPAQAAQLSKDKPVEDLLMEALFTAEETNAAAAEYTPEMEQRLRKTLDAEHRRRSAQRTDAILKGKPPPRPFRPS